MTGYSNGPLVLEDIIGPINWTQDHVFNEDVTIGSTSADILTVNATATFQNNVTFNDQIVFAGSTVQFQSGVTVSLDGTINFGATSLVTFDGPTEFNDPAIFNDDVTLGSTPADLVTIEADILVANGAASSQSVTFQSYVDIIVNGTLEMNSTSLLTLDGVVNWTGSTSSSASAGAVAIPANAVGYIVVQVNGTNRKIAYFAT